MQPRTQSTTLTPGELMPLPPENCYPAGVDPRTRIAVHDFPDSASSRDFGWWLLRDLFVRQKRWSELAKLDAKAIPIIKEGRQQIVDAALKRSLDCVVAFALLVMLSPLLALLVVLIKLDSRGPALFRHLRVGKRGKEFAMWKFRSMRVDAPMYERSPISRKDSRLTFIGRILRRVSLDELPQLINVLKGEMSLVGPRPEMAFIVEKYNTVERRRLLVKPGITGLWQISACRAAPIHHNPQYDLYYIQHQNIFLDAAILVRTISAVVRGMGAV